MCLEKFISGFKFNVKLNEYRVVKNIIFLMAFEVLNLKTFKDLRPEVFMLF